MSWAVEAKVKAKLDQNLLLQVLYVLSRECALLLTYQFIVSKDHILVVW